MASVKLERLMNLLAALLHTRVPLAASVVRERVGGYPDDDVAFHKQFSRDKADLRALGVPIEVEPVPGVIPSVDGYRVDPDRYYLPDPHLSADELAALHLATRLVNIGSGSVPAGLSKLGGAPMATSLDAPWASLPADPSLGILFDAVRNSRIVTFDYHDRPRTFLPRALGFQHGRWYVTGVDVSGEADDDPGDGDGDGDGEGAGAGAASRESRVYRLDRIRSHVEDVGGGGAVPGGPTRIGPFLPWRLGHRDPTSVRLLVDAIAVATVSAQLREFTMGEPDSEGAVVMTFEVTNVEGLRTWLLGLGPSVEVLGPPEVRDAVVTWLEAVPGVQR